MGHGSGVAPARRNNLREMQLHTFAPWQQRRIQVRDARSGRDRIARLLGRATVQCDRHGVGLGHRLSVVCQLKKSRLHRPSATSHPIDRWSAGVASAMRETRTINNPALRTAMARYRNRVSDIAVGQALNWRRHSRVCWLSTQHFSMCVLSGGGLEQQMLKKRSVGPPNPLALSRLLPTRIAPTATAV